MTLVNNEARYTYEDYCEWDDGERWELINGVPYAMAPGPLSDHQTILVQLTWMFQSFLDGKPCRLFIAPFDVRLDVGDEDDTVVQPDLFVVCDSSKLADKRFCKGAPDLVVEILSPSTARHDRLTKLNLYRRAGVREYWIIDPDTKIVQVCVFESGAVNGYGDNDDIPVSTLPGCIINLQGVFSQL